MTYLQYMSFNGRFSGEPGLAGFPLVFFLHLFLDENL